jgi:hypothetical protein
MYLFGFALPPESHLVRFPPTMHVLVWLCTATRISLGQVSYNHACTCLVLHCHQNLTWSSFLQPCLYLFVIALPLDSQVPVVEFSPTTIALVWLCTATRISLGQVSSNHHRTLHVWHCTAALILLSFSLFLLNLSSVLEILCIQIFLQS